MPARTTTLPISGASDCIWRASQNIPLHRVSRRSSHAQRVLRARWAIRSPDRLTPCRAHASVLRPVAATAANPLHTLHCRAPRWLQCGSRTFSHWRRLSPRGCMYPRHENHFRFILVYIRRVHCCRPCAQQMVIRFRSFAKLVVLLILAISL